MTSPHLAPTLTALQTVLTATKQNQQDRDARHRKVLTDQTPDVYWEVEERKKFYRWCYDECQRQGHEVRWPLGASVVAMQAYHGTGPGSEDGKLLGMVTDNLQAMLRRVNQIIFDDVLEKLGKLLSGTDKLQDQRAIDWDSGLLSEEQHLVQPLWQGIAKPDVKLAESLAAQTHFGSGFGRWWTKDEMEELLTGPGRKVADVPPFEGDITKVSSRWRHGMKLGKLLSTLTVTGQSPSEPPTPRPQYVDGSRLAAIDRRPNLHRYEAITDRPSIDNNDPIIQVLRQLNTHEQLLFMRHERFRNRLRLVVNPIWLTVFPIVVSWRIDLEGQLRLLDKIPGNDWRPIKYHDVKPLVRGSTPEQRAKIRGAFWRDFFVDNICENDTIVEAVDDLGLSDPERQQWIDAED